MNSHVCICSSGVTFYNQLSEIFEKRRQEITTICKSENERLQKIVDKAKQLKGIFKIEMNTLATELRVGSSV